MDLLTTRRPLENALNHGDALLLELGTEDSARLLVVRLAHTRLGERAIEDELDGDSAGHSDGEGP